MKPTTQTKLTPPDGNCFAACVASILECPLDEVPQPTVQDDADPVWRAYWTRVADWLAGRNLGLIEFPVSDNGYKPPGYSVLTTGSVNGEYMHAVVALDGEVVWNPFPGQGASSVGEWRFWTVFVVLDPAKGCNP